MPLHDHVPAVIAGIGHTDYSSASGRLERELAMEAITAALDDAGLDIKDVDGLVTYDIDSNDPLLLAHEMALPELSWFSRTPYGGGLPCAAVQDAALAIDAGVASVVVAFRAANMRSGQRYGTGEGRTAAQNQYVEWTAPVGLSTPAQMGALWMHRYLHDRGMTADDLAPIVLASRHYAATNPSSRFYGQTFTLDDYLASPWAVEPVLRVPDCCLESDGGAAVVITRPDITAAHGKPVAAIRGAARGMARGSSIIQDYYRRDLGTFPDLQVALSQVWHQTGIEAADLSAAIIYDAFSPFIYVALEELGICTGDEVAAFVAGGGIGQHGHLPVNMNGGQLSEAYLHGFNGIIEAVRQIRGTAVNQVADVEHILVTGGPALPTSAMVLSPWAAGKRG